MDRSGRIRPCSCPMNQIWNFVNNFLGSVAAVLSITSGAISLSIESSFSGVVVSWTATVLLAQIGLLLLIFHPPNLNRSSVYIWVCFLSILSIVSFIGYGFLHGFLPGTSIPDEYPVLAKISLGVSFGLGCATWSWIVGLISVTRP